MELRTSTDLAPVAQTTQPLRFHPQGTWELKPGASIGAGRTILSALGGGADYEVFVVADERRGRCVAKVTRPELVECGEACGVLVAEARALQHANGPGVVRCLDVVLRGPRPHLLLEYVSGPTLRELLRRGHTPSPSAIAALGEALAATLAGVADRGWVHLDVKPENIIARPRPTLLDFSIARPAPDAAQLRAAIGTTAYMAPEQRQAGKTLVPIGPPADVYALAVTLHEAAAGRMPGWLRDTLEPALDEVPGRRPTAEAFATALRRASDSARQVASVGWRRRG